MTPLKMEQSLQVDNADSSATRLWPGLVLCLILGIIPFLVYSNSFDSPFVADDYEYIQRNPDIKKFPLPAYLTKLRPLNKATYWLNWKLHAFRMPGYRLVNIALHACAGILLYFLFRRVLRLYGPVRPEGSAVHGALAFGGALIYLLHPLHTQAVNYIFARSELLCACFVYAAFLVHLRKDASEYGYGRGIAVGLLFLLAVASKERAFMFFPALLLFDIMVRRDEGWPAHCRRWLKLVVPLFIAGALGAINFYLGFMDQHEGAIGTGHDVPEPWPYFLTQMVVRFHYLKLYFWPTDLSFDYLFTLRESLADPALLLSVAGHAVLFIAALLLVKRNGLIAFGIFWFFLLLLPTSGLAATAWYMHEHWIYIPSFGIFLVVLALIQRALAMHGAHRPPAWFRIAAALLLAGLSVLLGAMSFERNKVWQSNLSLWQDSIPNAEERPWLWNHIGVAYLDLKEYDEAIECLKRSEGLGGPNAALHQSIGLALLEKGDHEGAMKRLKEALRMSPKRPEVLAALGRLHSRLDQPGKAVQYYEEARKNGLPSYPYEFFVDGARVSERSGNTEQALQIVKQGLKFFPNSEELKEMLAEMNKDEP
jgi:tetratricopeptide (TPR) repeat protein